MWQKKEHQVNRIRKSDAKKRRESNLGVGEEVTLEFFLKEYKRQNINCKCQKKDYQS